jgi:hypothetical protein
MIVLPFLSEQCLVLFCVLVVVNVTVLFCAPIVINVTALFLALSDAIVTVMFSAPIAVILTALSCEMWCLKNICH